MTVEGTTYRTKPLAIEVVDEGKAPGGGGSAAGGQPQRREEASSESAAQSRVAKDDILLRAIVSRTSVFKGEPLRVTFKLYERVPIVGYNDVKFPSFNGFWAQELNTENARRERETFNGKVYETLVAKEYLLYPQQAGYARHRACRDHRRGAGRHPEPAQPRSLLRGRARFRERTPQGAEPADKRHGQTAAGGRSCQLQRRRRQFCDGCGAAA